LIATGWYQAFSPQMWLSFTHSIPQLNEGACFTTERTCFLAFHQAVLMFDEGSRVHIKAVLSLSIGCVQPSTKLGLYHQKYGRNVFDKFMIRWLMISLRVTLIISDELGITFFSNQYHGAKEGIERCIWCSLKQSSRPPRVGDGMFIKPVDFSPRSRRK
jgi:hypothetical protein